MKTSHSGTPIQAVISLMALSMLGCDAQTGTVGRTGAEEASSAFARVPKTLSAVSAVQTYQISADVFGSPLVIATSLRTAGAISSLQWRGQDFINDLDHGRELQSASAYDGYGECLNPTEAGSRRDLSTSTSQLLGIRASGNQLSTTVRMAFWTPAGDPYPSGCGGPGGQVHAQNTADLSNDLISKQVTIGYSGLENVIEYLVTFQTAEPHSSAVFEVLTGYMTADFTSFWAFDPERNAIQPLSAEPGEQTQPVILSTPQQTHAMGIYSPDLPQGNLGYGRFAFPGDTMKWNAVFRRDDTPPGNYNFRTYVVVGNLEQVKTSMEALHRLFHPGSGPVAGSESPPAGLGLAPVYRFFNTANGMHFESGLSTEGSGVWVLDGILFDIYTSNAASRHPLYRCFVAGNGDHFTSMDSRCEGQVAEGPMGFVEDQPTAGATRALLRCFNPLIGHLETVTASECVSFGYQQEGTLGFVP